MKAAAKSTAGPSPARLGDGAHATALAPRQASLATLRKIAAGCQACELWKHATQTVFGEGGSKATLMLIGEQPGDKEDLAGHPFVGPAGRILNTALQEAGIERRDVYVTNVVKHFKWAPQERGKRRIHKKPLQSEIEACRPWLEAEIRVVRPDVLVCLGATAGQSLLGKSFSVMRDRGKVMASEFGSKIIATVHPSSILRAQDDESRRAQMQAFVDDLQTISTLIHKGE
jgi:uracil-DNA glycosylase